MCPILQLFVCRRGKYAGDLLLAKEDAELWSMQEDEVGDIVFVHAETQASASVGIPEFLCMEREGVFAVHQAPEEAL